MPTIHFIGGEKGGVGKSLVARLAAQYLIDHQRPFLGFDSDRSHGALLRFYPDYTSPMLIERYDHLDKLIESAIDTPQRAILVDLAAQTHQPLLQWMDDSGMLELAAEFDIRVRYWHVMDSGRDSVDLLGRLLERFGAQLEYVLVLNQLRGDDFGIFDASGLRQRALSLGARIVNLPRLHEPTMTRIDAYSSSFWAATTQHDRAFSGLGLLERQRVKLWLNKAYAGLVSGLD